MPKYPAETPIAAVQPVVDHEKYRLHTYQAAVGVPFSQALISAGIVGGGFIALAWLFGADEPWKFGLVSACLTLAVIWFFNQKHWLNLTKLEEWTGLELDGQPGIGEPPPVVRIDLTRKVGATRQTQFLEIPCSPEQLKALAVGIVNRRMPFSGRVWSGKGKPFSDGEFRELRAYFIKKMLLVQSSDKDEHAGYVFNRDGIDMLRDYLPSPTDDEGEN